MRVSSVYMDDKRLSSHRSSNTLSQLKNSKLLILLINSDMLAIRCVPFALECVRLCFFAFFPSNVVVVYWIECSQYDRHARICSWNWIRLQFWLTVKFRLCQVKWPRIGFVLLFSAPAAQSNFAGKNSFSWNGQSCFWIFFSKNMYRSNVSNWMLLMFSVCSVNAYWVCLRVVQSSDVLGLTYNTHNNLTAPLFACMQHLWWCWTNLNTNVVCAVKMRC